MKSTVFAGVEVALMNRRCSCGGDWGIDSARNGKAISTFSPFDEHFLSAGDFMCTLMTRLPFDSASYYQQIQFVMIKFCI